MIKKLLSPIMLVLFFAVTVNGQSKQMTNDDFSSTEKSKSPTDINSLPEKEAYSPINKEFIVDGIKFFNYGYFFKNKGTITLQRQIDPPSKTFSLTAKQNTNLIIYSLTSVQLANYATLIENWSKNPPQIEETKTITDILGNQLAVQSQSGSPIFVHFRDKNGINNFAILLRPNSVTSFIKLLRSPLGQ